MNVCLRTAVRVSAEAEQSFSLCPLCCTYIHLYTLIYHYQFTSSLNENNIISSKYRARYFVIAIID